MDYQQEIAAIDEFIRQEHYKQAGNTMGRILESALQDAYGQVKLRARPQDMKSLIELEERLGNGKPYTEFMLGQLLGLYREGKVFKLIERYLKRKLKRAPRIPMDDLNDIRIRSSHSGVDGSDEDVTLEDLEYFQSNLKTLLLDLGLIAAGAGGGTGRAAQASVGNGATPRQAGAWDVRCPACGESVQPHWMQCPSCGTALKVKCRVCGELLEPHWKACPACGTPVGGDGQGSTGARGAVGGAQATGRTGGEAQASPSVDSLIETVCVEPGEFTMGDGGQFSGREHTVDITQGFLMGVTPVTFDQYDRYCKGTGVEKPDDDGWGRGKRPVINVTWYDAVRFANWLSEQEGFEPAYILEGDEEEPEVLWNEQADGWRLPTEAEWEFAAQGGTQSKGYEYAGSDDVNAVAWYDENSGDKTRPVGLKRSNELGLHDMSGNVYEWCWDWFDGDYYENSPAVDPTGPAWGERRVLRGGSWGLGGGHARVADRLRFFPVGRIISCGFRLVRPSSSR